MSRSGRVFVQNACNHILARGNEKMVVFKNDGDYDKYLKLIHTYKLRYGCLIFGYCLMPNHPHLALESPRGLRAMSSFMHCINQSYAMGFNKRYDRVGHLWQNRYKNFVVLKDKYLQNLITYIEFNPVRAGIVSRPEDYRWSSYRGRVLGKKDIILDALAGGQV